MKNKRMKVVTIAGGIIFVIMLALPAVVNIDRFRPQLESSLASSLGREVHVGHMSLSLLAGGARVEQISISDDPAFRDGAFLQAKSLGIGVSFLSLIFTRSLHITSLTLDEPKVTAIQSPDGKWNFATLGNANRKNSDGTESAGAVSPTPQVVLDHLRISNATIDLTSGQAENGATTLRNIDVDFKDVSLERAMSFVVSAHSHTGKLKIEGEAGPINSFDPKRTPFHASIAANKVDLGEIAALGASSGLSGILTMVATVKSDGKTMHSEGQASADELRLVHGAKPANQTVSLRYETNYDITQKTGVIRNGEIEAGKSMASLSGTYDDHRSTLVIHARIAGNQLPVDSVEGILPALGIALPDGSKFHGGTVSANLSVDGPVDRVVTAGSVQIANAHLADFDLASKLSILPGMTAHNGDGHNGDSDLSIMNLGAHLRISPEGTYISGLDGRFGGIGSITGNGNIGPANHLEFKMVAHVAGNGVARIGLNRVGMRSLPNDIPFRVVGTTSVPIIIPDLTGMAKASAKSVVTNIAGGTGRAAISRVGATCPQSPAAVPVQTTSNKKSGFFRNLFHHKASQSNTSNGMQAAAQ